jgi:hypothetical protein
LSVSCGPNCFVKSTPGQQQGDLFAEREDRQDGEAEPGARAGDQEAAKRLREGERRSARCDLSVT